MNIKHIDFFVSTSFSNEERWPESYFLSTNSSTNCFVLVHHLSEIYLWQPLHH
jgi:hypothetical protein